MKYEVEIGHYGYGWDIIQRFADGSKLVIATFHNNGGPTKAKALALEYTEILNKRIKYEN